MQYFYLRDNINQDTFDKFVQFYNGVGDNEITIVIDSGGGSNMICEAMIYMLNQKQKVTTIIMGAFSSAMYLAVKLKGEKILTNTCLGMWHYTKWALDFNDKLKPYYKQDEGIIKNMPRNKKISETFAKSIMTTAEYKKYLNDDDVYFHFNRMKQIFPTAKIL